MARPHKPKQLHKLAGTYRNDRKPENEPEAIKPDVCPKAPKFLDGVARQEWDRIAGELYEIGLLNNLNLVNVIGYCRNYSIWVALMKEVKKIEEKAGSILASQVMKSPSGAMQESALEGAVKRAGDQMLAFAKKIPLSPVDMAKVSVPKKKAKTEQEQYNERFRVVK